MKKLFIGILLLTILFPINIKPVEAICGCRCTPGICPGDMVLDIQRLMSQLKLISTKVLGLNEQTMTNISDAATQVNTYKTMYDQTIRRPLKDAMTLMSITNSSNQILNLVNGSTNGKPLIIENPAGFIKNKGDASTQASTNLVERTNGYYSDSLLTGIREMKQKDGADSSLIASTQSAIPSTIQKNACADANLSARARNDITQGGNLPFNQEAYDARRQALYNSLCTGNPNADKAQAKKLVAASNEDFSLCGWDCWLEETVGGDTEFTKTTEAVAIAQEKASSTEALALSDYYEGKGIESQRMCIQRDSKGVCTKDKIITPGSVLKDELTEAKLANLKTAISTFGKGGDGGGVFSDLSDMLGLDLGGAFASVGDITSIAKDVSGVVGDVNGVVNTVGGGSGGTSGGTSGGGTVSTGGGNTSVVTAHSYAQDLAGDSTRKATLLLPLQKILTAHIKALNNMKAIDDEYISQIEYYKSLVSGVKTCYANVEAFASSNGMSSPTPQSIFDFYSNETRLSNDLIAKLQTERDVTVPAAQKIIQDTQTAINNSNSSEEITALSEAYHDKIDSASLPGVNADGLRQGDYQAYKSDIEIAQMEQGRVGLNTKGCNDARAQIQSDINTRNSSSGPY